RLTNDARASVGAAAIVGRREAVEPQHLGAAGCQVIEGGAADAAGPQHDHIVGHSAASKSRRRCKVLLRPHPSDRKLPRWIYRIRFSSKRQQTLASLARFGPMAGIGAGNRNSARVWRQSISPTALAAVARDGPRGGAVAAAVLAAGRAAERAGGARRGAAP